MDPNRFRRTNNQHHRPQFTQFRPNERQQYHSLPSLLGPNLFGSGSPPSNLHWRSQQPYRNNNEPSYDEPSYNKPSYNSQSTGSFRHAGGSYNNHSSGYVQHTGMQNEPTTYSCDNPMVMQQNRFQSASAGPNSARNNSNNMQVPPLLHTYSQPSRGLNVGNRSGEVAQFGFGVRNVCQEPSTGRDFSRVTSNVDNRMGKLGQCGSNVSGGPKTGRRGASNVTGVSNVGRPGSNVSGVSNVGRPGSNVSGVSNVGRPGSRGSVVSNVGRPGSRVSVVSNVDRPGGNVSGISSPGHSGGNFFRVPNNRRPGGYNNRNIKVHVSPRKSSPPQPYRSGAKSVSSRVTVNIDARCIDSGRSPDKLNKHSAIQAIEHDINTEHSDRSNIATTLENKTDDKKVSNTNEETVTGVEETDDASGMVADCGDVSKDNQIETSKTEGQYYQDKNLSDEASTSHKIDPSDAADTAASAEVLVIENMTKHLCLKADATNDGPTASGEIIDAQNHSSMLDNDPDEDKQLLKEHNIENVCAVNLGPRCNIFDILNMDNNTNVNRTRENMVENVATTSRIPVERKSPVSFLSYDDTIIESMDSEDSDDEELLAAAPAFLQSIEDIINRPAPTTPTRALDSTPNSSQNFSRDCESPDLVRIKPCKTLTLDGLFQEHEEHADNVKEMDEINQELQDDIKQGGFVRMLDKEEAVPDESFTDEQRQMLRQLEVQETSLHHDWPGVILFKPEHYQCLFTSTVHPTHCEFVAASTGGRLEKYMQSLSVDQYKMVITSQMTPRLFTRITNQNQLLRWLFYIMSIHDDDDIQHGSYEMLLGILHSQYVDGQPKWTPRLIDVLSVLVNYGACLESLLPCGPSDVDIIRGKLFQQPGYSRHDNVPQAGYRINNLMLVLRVVAQSLQGQSGRYSPNDATLLFYALCKVILDPSTKHCACSMEVLQNCLTMVIRQYTESDWLKERLRLCRLLPGLSSHHHDHSHVAQLLPSDERGAYIQQRYSYLVISRTLTGKVDISDNELDNFEIGYLEKFVNYIRDLFENDPYTLSSVIKLLELSVGVNYTLNTTQREQLKSLQEKVSEVRVRDSIGMLDRARVKNMIVLVTRRWALELQTVRRKQTKIFEYTSSPVKMHIETLKPVQSSEDEDEVSENEDVPRKIRKLSNDDIEVNSQNIAVCEALNMNSEVGNGDISGKSCTVAGLNGGGDQVEVGGCESQDVSKNNENCVEIEEVPSLHTDHDSITSNVTAQNITNLTSVT